MGDAAVWKLEGWHLDHRPVDPADPDQDARTKRGYRKMNPTPEIRSEDPLPALEQLVQMLRGMPVEDRRDMYKAGVERKKDANEILDAREATQEERPRSVDAGEDEAAHTTESESEADHD